MKQVNTNLNQKKFEAMDSLKPTEELTIEEKFSTINGISSTHKILSVQFLIKDINDFQILAKLIRK